MAVESGAPALTGRGLQALRGITAHEARSSIIRKERSQMVEKIDCVCTVLQTLVMLYALKYSK